jgi:hypothetical protein
MTSTKPNRLIIRDLPGGYLDIGIHWSDHRVPEPVVSPFRFSQPLSSAEREALRSYLEEYLFDADIFSINCFPDQLSSWGERLFNSIIKDDQLTKVYGYLSSHHSLNPYEVIIQSSDPAFLDFPWEIIKDPGKPNPICIDAADISRVIPCNEPSFEFESKLSEFRILLVIARPDGLDDVDYRSIGRSLVENLAANEISLTVDLCRPPTFERLVEKIQLATRERRPYQVVHFDGHAVASGFGIKGSDTSKFEEDCLVFESPRAGGPDPVRASRFSSALRDGRVSLVVLNACRSARVREFLDVGVATSLLRAGVAAVVAMSYAIYVKLRPISLRNSTKRWWLVKLFPRL